MDDAETTPPEIIKSENEVYEWLKSNGLVVPCPFESRIPDRERGRHLAELVKSLGFRYGNSTLGNYEVYEDRQREVVSRLGRFAESMPDHLRGGGGLLLCGDPGTGKDHLIAALLKLAIRLHGLAVRWHDGGDLFDKIHNAMREESGESWMRLSADLQKPHVLALSDPQPPQDALSPSQVRRLRDIIDRRYRAGKSTWITTNLDQRGYAEQLFTKPVMDRLKESSAVILCDWPSYRARRKAGW